MKREPIQSYSLFSRHYQKPSDDAAHYHLSDLIDLPLLHQLLDAFYETSGIAYSIIDRQNNILRGRGWQDICVQFHRACPAAEACCLESDSYILTHFQDGPYVGYMCPNGLMDYAAPIVVEGQYLGGIFSGQFFHKPPDENHFRRQARKYGFDETAYIHALRRVPILPEALIHSVMLFYARLGQVLSAIGLERKRWLDSAHNAIRQHEERLELVWNISNEGFWDWDLSSQAIYFSPRMAEITGYAPEELDQNIRTWKATIHPEDQDRVIQHVHQYLTGSLPEYEAEFRIITKSGQWKWISDRGQVVARDEQDRPLRMVGTRIDLSSRKQAEISLRQSENKFAKVFHCSPDLMAISTLEDGRYVEVNDAFVRLTGYQREETIGRTVVELGIWVNPSIRDDMIQVLLDQGSIQGFELDLRTKAGDIRTLSLSGEIVQIDGKSHLLNVSRDITESKKILEQLRLSEDCFAKAFNVSPIVMSISTLDEGRYLKVNDAFCRIAGYDHKEVIGRSSLEIGFWSDPLDRKRVMDKIMAENSIHDMEFHFRNHLGEERLGLYSAEIIEVDGTTCLLSVLTDITQQRRIEAEMNRLDRLNLVGEMAASIGHEIRNPMTTVRGFLQMMREEPDHDHKMEYLDLMIEELDRANSIITEFLSLAKDKVVELNPENLNNIIDKLQPLLEAKAMIRDQGISLELGDLPDLYLDKKEIRQLILNLVNNGLESMSPGGILTVRTYIEQDAIVLAIQDLGHGIVTDLINKLGTPFLTTKEQGTGLGLAVCFRIAARHNARIDIQTSPSGTTFFVRFHIH